MMAQGEQMGALGGALADYAQQQQQRVNKIRSDNAFLALQRDAAVFEQELKQLNGEQAIGAYTLYGDRLQERANELSRDLPAIAQEDFMLRAGALQNQFFGIGLEHEAKQLEFMEDNALSARIVAGAEMISLDPANVRRVDQQRDDIRAALTEKYRKAGRTGEDLEQAVRTDMGKLHETIMDNMINAGDYVGASNYFERVKDSDMLVTFAEAMQNKIDAGTAEAEALTVVDALVGTMPDAFDSPAAADKWLRDNVSNPKALDAARDEYTRRKTVQEQQKKITDVENYNTAIGIMNERGFGAARASAAYNSLSPDQQNAIRDYWELRQDKLTNRAEARETRERNDIIRRQNDAYTSIIAGQTEQYNVATMSQADFDMYQMTVGEENMLKLRQLRAQMLADPTKAIEVEIDNDLFNTLALDFGYSPLSTDPDDVQEITRLRSTLEGLVSAAQQAKPDQRKLTYNEKRELMMEAFRTRFVPSYLNVPKNWMWEEGRVRTDIASPSTLARLSQLRARDIPEQERVQIVRALGETYSQTRQEKYNPTKEENIVAVYLAKRGYGPDGKALEPVE